MSASNTPALRNGRATRSSLACLPCRRRHMKCDGNRPSCNRCAETAKECHYSQSRRGGLDRAALAALRRQRAAAAATAASEEAGVTDNSNSQRLPGPQQDQEFRTHVVEPDFIRGYGPQVEIDSGNGTSITPLPTATRIHIDSVEEDPLIDSYYKNFHKFHPLLLPKKHLAIHYRVPSKQPTLKPLIAIVRFIGNIYSAGDWSIPLKDYADACFSQAEPTDPTMVQCRLLSSVAHFWYDHKIDAIQEMNTAFQLAVDLQMFRKEFAAKHGSGDAVLMECWRRTWWTLSIVDAYYAGTLKTMRFRVLDFEATVELPCEESDYELGEIPEPKTLQEFDHREFTSDITTFSSFAYLIGAVRCIALAISTAPQVANKQDSMHILQTADSILNGWLLLLPTDRKQIMTKTGEIDELMFQAHLLIHVATIGLHRPLSDLKYNLVEGVSGCAREPPPDTPTGELANIHTERVLRSVEAQIQILALPVRQFHHSPFVTCMISEGTLALLSACKFRLKEMKLTIARNQIRMAIGCLNALAELWPRTARNVREIQTIAHHVLGLGSKTVNNNGTPMPSEVPLLSGGGQRSVGSEAEASGNYTDIPPSRDTYEDLCGWYNLGDLGDLDLSCPFVMNNSHEM
ncbi:hypothetical protein N7474_005447 [Penicillium riverlandense]|uniref:uncharacterized protein n=1 Tax=Penicillium riverlandense TaxID=1903569 RepID=UPI002547487F|nr:uncharacterized protein N7474_005447 [Penicillium riverlandense]KAJ5819856.1 hypothetical protein N7474_005447 [Penicillium riverlandense]